MDPRIISDAEADAGHSERVSETVIEEVAMVTGVDPLDMEPLFSAIDPDALNALFRQTGGSTSMSLTLHFTMEGCEVLVHGDGDVDVIPPLELDGSPVACVPTDD